MISISTDKIDFNKSIPQGTIIELVTKVGTTSCVVSTSIFIEEMYNYSREEVVTGKFTFVAIDDDKKPTAIL